MERERERERERESMFVCLFIFTDVHSGVILHVHAALNSSFISIDMPFYIRIKKKN